MKEDIEIFNKEYFIRKFIKKFNGFLNNAPVKARGKIIQDSIEITIEGFEKPFIHHFDYHKSIFDNIYLIKIMLLERAYPVLNIYRQIETDFSQEEIETLISSGTPISEALEMKKKEIRKEEYKIEKVYIKNDILYLQGINYPYKRYMYKLHNIPVSIFLKRLRTKWDELKASEVFIENAELIKELKGSYYSD